MFADIEPGVDDRKAPQATARSLRDWIADQREKLLANPKFRSFCVSTPLLRSITCRRTRELFDVCVGFVYTQTLYACVQSDLLTFVKGSPRCINQISLHTELPVEVAERLCRAALSLDLLRQRSDGRYGLGDKGAVVASDKGIEAMVHHHRLLYRDLTDPLARLRGTAAPSELNAFWAYANNPTASGLNAQRTNDYSALMAASQTMVADEVLKAFSFQGVSRLLDIGGGDGTFVSHVATAHPKLKLGLFDLPSVIEQAEKRLSIAGHLSRISVHPGNFARDSLPSGADLVTLVRIVHDHDDVVVRRLLKAIYDALPVGGRLMIAEPMSETPGAEPIGDAYFGLYLFTMGSGRPRTMAELRDLCSDTGFVRLNEVPTRNPALLRILLAQKRS